MKRILLLLTLLACCFTARADSTNYVATITFTNVVAGVTNGDTITVNGDVRRYTNGTLAVASTWINSTNIVGYVATNTTIHLATYPPVNVDVFTYVSTNAFTIRSDFDETLTVTLSAGIGTVTYVTNVYQPVRPLALPIDALLVASTRTNSQNRLVEALNLSYATGKVVSGAAIMTNFVNLFNSQTLSNKFVFTLSVVGLTATNGTLSGQHITNATLISGTFAMGTNGTFQNPTINQAISISGNLGSVTNGTSYGLALVNIASLRGIVTALTNGYATNLALGNPLLTNGVNYGNAFSSPGSGSGSEQYGNQAAATGGEAFAGGFGSLASGYISAAVGSGSTASGGNSGAFASGASATETNALAVGGNSTVLAPHGSAFGANTTVGATHTNSFVIGTGGATTTWDQGVIGASTHTVSLPGLLSVGGTITNATHTGAQKFGVTGGPYGTISIARYNNTGLANGNNAAVNINGSSYMKVSGPTAAYALNGITNSAAGNLDGLRVVIQKSDSYTLTIANDSGVDPIAANRIYTGTGADMTLTNNPGFFELIYDSATSRWGVLSKSN
jgi:hypothetical protein